MLFSHLASLPFADLPLAEFSRQNCLTICAFLVPANLLATLAVMVSTALRQPLQQRAIARSLATLFAVTMVLHVWTWFAVGVVQAPTFILLSLAVLCLGIHAAAARFPHAFVLAYRWLRRAFWYRWQLRES